MDFAKRDYRAQAEEGFFCQLVDPYTKEPIVSDNGEKTGFWLQGIIAPSVQKRLDAEFAKARKAAKAREAAGEGADDELDDGFLNAMHESLVDSAMLYIIRAENCEWDGRPVVDDADDIRRILNTISPQFRVEAGEMVPLNNPYAKQVVEAAESYTDFLAEPAKA